MDIFFVCSAIYFDSISDIGIIYCFLNGDEISISFIVNNPGSSICCSLVKIIVIIFLSLVFFGRIDSFATDIIPDMSVFQNALFRRS